MKDVQVHIALIKFRNDVPEEQRAQILRLYSTIAEDCGGKDAGIRLFEVKQNLDDRKGWHLVEFSIFTGPEAVEAFRVHPKHRELTDILREIADWAVGDITSDGDSIVRALTS